MTTVSFYDQATGLFTGRTFSGSARLVEMNTPPGQAAIEGLHDRLSRRVDIETGEVIDYQPPQPSRDHEWNDTTRRWELNSAAALALKAERDAKNRMELLEQQSLRSLRELVLDQNNQAARDKLQQVETEIATLRPAVLKTQETP